MSSKLAMFDETCDGIIPHTNGHFAVDIEGNVFSTLTKKRVEAFYEDGELYINLPIHLTANAWNNIRLKLASVTSVVYKKYDIPLYLWNAIEVYYVDGDVFNVHPSNIIHQRYSDKFTVWFPDDDLPYKIVPNYTRYAINEKGVLRRRLDGMVCAYTTKEGYVTFTVHSDLGKFGARRHRVLALAFHDYPVEVDSLDVNHINSVPGSDELDNLEWLSRRDNNLHGVYSGRHPQAEIVESMNVYTGEVVEYPSTRSASVETKQNKGSVWSSITRNYDIGLTSKPMHLWRFKSDKAWNRAKMDKRRFVELTSILIFNVITKEVVTYSNVEQATRYLSSITGLSIKNVRLSINLHTPDGNCFGIGDFLVRRVIQQDTVSAIRPLTGK